MRTFVLLPLLAAGCLLVAGPGRTAGPEIADQADFFSQRAERQAASLMDELQRKHGVEVRIETFNQPPGGQADRVKSMSARERGQFFQDLLKRLARERRAKGIFLLVSREPSHLRMGVSQELHQRGFTDADRDAAVDAMMSAFREKDYDRGLISALETIRSRAQRGLQVAAAPPLGSGSKMRTPPAPAGTPATGAADSPLFGIGGWLCMGVGALVVMMLLVSIVSALFRRNGMTPAGAGGPGGYPGQGGYMGQGGNSGGGGWGGGMLGGALSGLGGALLGNWVYDQFSGRSAHAGYPDSGHASPPMQGAPPAEHYDDFRSGGGDFGDSGGGDFGGGNFGGGGDGGGDF